MTKRIMVMIMLTVTYSQGIIALKLLAETLDFGSKIGIIPNNQFFSVTCSSVRSKSLERKTDMSKGRAFTWFIGCGITALVCFSLQGVFSSSAVVCGFSAIMATAYFFCVWLVKYIRDAELKVSSGKTETMETPITITSPGSSRLFVPNPLDRR